MKTPETPKTDATDNGKYVATGWWEKFLDKRLDHRVIHNCDGDAYLKRWYLVRRDSFAIFIHKFIRSDEDRAALHSHPWDFLVIPVWRGYNEHNMRPDWSTYTFVDHVTRVLPILGIRFRRAEYRHRVELIEGKPAWSIFVRFTKRVEWGFWPKTGFLHWKEFWKINCGED